MKEVLAQKEETNHRDASRILKYLMPSRQLSIAMASHAHASIKEKKPLLAH